MSNPTKTRERPYLHEKIHRLLYDEFRDDMGISWRDRYPPNDDRLSKVTNEILKLVDEDRAQ